MRVSDLIMLPPMTGIIILLINDLFDARDVGLILKLPIASSFDDSWHWRGDIKGLYTVKNGYRLVCGKEELGSGTAITSHGLSLILPQIVTAQDTMQVFVDAAVFLDPNDAYFGVFIQSGSNFVAAKNGPVRCMGDPHLAEAFAVG
nr:receptor-like protein 12 [Ipomoea batatas]